MKICMLTTGHWALDDRIYYKEALSLRKKYDEVFIIAPDDREEYWENNIKVIGVEKPKSILDRYKLSEKVVEKAIELKADVYHFHDFEMIYKIMKIKKSLPNSKIVYDVHEHYPDMIRMSRKVPSAIKPFATFFVDKTETHIAKKFDYIITADDAVKERFDAFNRNVDVIYNFSEFNIKENDDTEKVYDAIYQGGITIERGVFNVVKAIEIAKKTVINIKMAFVGPFYDEKSKEMVFKYIKDNNLSENIEFVGKVPHKDVEGYIRKSRMGIVTLLPLPKYFKNIPIKQFEYMGCGIPIIGSYMPPIKKFIESYNSGIIVDPEKPSDIAEAIVRLLESSELRKEMGSNGIRAVTESYNWGQMEKKLLKLYEKISNMA